MITRELLISNLRTFYPKRSNPTQLQLAEWAFAQWCILQLAVRAEINRIDFHLLLWMALPHDPAFIRFMPMREKML